MRFEFPSPTSFFKLFRVVMSFIDFLCPLFNLGRYLGGAKGTETPQYPSNVQGEQVSLATTTVIFAGILRVAGRGGIAKVTNIRIFNHFSYLVKRLLDRCILYHVGDRVELSKPV